MSDFLICKYPICPPDVYKSKPLSMDILTSFIKSASDLFIQLFFVPEISMPITMYSVSSFEKILLIALFLRKCINFFAIFVLLSS